MFEKEAKKHKEEFITSYISLGGGLKSAGVIGMQKEMSYKEGAEFGYNKANEWHYVKDELPNEGTYLVVWQNDKGYKEIFIMHYEEDDEEELHWIDGDCEVQDEYIIAWKEITPPKEVKE